MPISLKTFSAPIAAGCIAFGLHASSAMAAGGSGGGGTSTGGGSPSPTDVEVPGEILVKLRTTAALGPLLAKYPVTLVSRFGARPIYRLKTIGAVRVKDVLPALALEPDVMIAESNASQRSPEARGNQAWAIGTAQGFAVQWAPQAMHLAQAQALSTGAGVRVAVLDTGVDATHPSLAGHLGRGHDFVDDDDDPSEVGSVANPSYGHGTHVAGLIAMAAPGATILPLRVLDPNGVGNAWVLAEALLYAVDPDGNPSTDDGAQVINISLGSLTRTRLLGAITRLASCEAAVPDDPAGDRSDPGYSDDETRCATGRGAVVVAAAGNDASSSVKQYPAAEGVRGLLAVTASRAGAKLASFSNFGSWVDLAAPGDLVTSTLPGGFGTWSGTSMAAPLAAATVALVVAVDPTLRPADLVQRLKRSSTTLCGTGLRQVDAAAAVNNIAPPILSCR